MVEIFRTLGVDAVPGVGQPFDPNFHDAVMREQNDEVPDGTVLQEFRKGFRHGDKLLRPAMVKVRDLSYSQVKQAVDLAWQLLCHAGLDAQAGHQNDAADHAQLSDSTYGVSLTSWQGSRLHSGRHVVTLLEAAWACLAGGLVQKGRCVLPRPASITAWGCWEEMELQSCSPDVACLLYLRHADCWVCRCLSAMRQMPATAAQGQKPLRVLM